MLCGLTVGTCCHAKPKITTLPAISQWLVDYQKTSCVMVRRFGTSKRPVLLSMRTYGPGRDFEVTVAGEIAARLQQAPQFGIAYGLHELSFPSLHHNARAGAYGPAVLFSSALATRKHRQVGGLAAEPMPDSDFEATVDRISLATSHQTFVLDTGSVLPVLSALRTCTDALVRNWGLDPAEQAELTRLPKVADKKWISEILKDFPSELEYQGKDGRLNLRVMVDKAGQPTQCETVNAFRNANFNTKVCDMVIGMARFEPALDSNGQPVASFFSGSIVYDN